MIMDTEMARHADKMQEYVIVCDKMSSGGQLTEDERIQVMGTLIHAFDLNVVTKTFDDFAKWAFRISQEFYD